jgi:hypothetical protein
MKEFFVKLGAFFKKVGTWFVRIFEDKDGLPSSKRVFGAGLLVFGVIAAFNLADPFMVGVLIGGGLGMFGVSSWSK